MRWVLVLNSARCRSAGVGLAGDLPKIERSSPAIKAKNEFTLVPKDIF